MLSRKYARFIFYSNEINTCHPLSSNPTLNFTLRTIRDVMSGSVLANCTPTRRKRNRPARQRKISDAQISPECWERTEGEEKETAWPPPKSCGAGGSTNRRPPPPRGRTPVCALGR